jgi:predicted dehydrogenase
MENPLRVVLVGCGYIAQAEHIPNWLQSRRGRLVAVVDSREGLARETGERLSLPWFTEAGQALAACDSNAVHICTPPASHADLVGLAAKTGRHVLVEKPLAPTASAAADIVRVAGEASIRCMVGYHKFFDTDLTELARRLRAGDLGRVLGIESVWKLSLPPVWPGRSAWPRTMLPAAELSSAELLRHLLLDQSIHHFSLFRRWVGEAVRVEAVQQSGPLWHVTLTFTGDVPIWHTNAGPVAHGDEIRVYGEEGIYEAWPWSPHFPWSFGASRFARRTGEMIVPALARCNPYAAQIEEFVASVRERRAPLADAAEAVEDIRLVERIVEAFEARAASGRN